MAFKNENDGMQLFLIINLFILFDIFVMHLNGEPSIFNLKIYYSVKMSPNYTMFILNAWNHHGPLLKAHIVWPIRYGPYQWSYCTKTKQDCTTSKVRGVWFWCRKEVVTWRHMHAVTILVHLISLRNLWSCAL